MLIANLMLSFGAGDLAKHGIPVWQIASQTGVATFGIMLAGGFLGMSGRQLSWPWVAGSNAVASMALFATVLLRPESGSFMPLVTVAMAVYGVAAGFGQLSEQTAAIAGVEHEGRRSEAVSAIMRWHLVGGAVFGGLPLLVPWQVAQVVLAITFLALAVVAAVRRRPAGERGEPYSLRRLLAETGPGAGIVATGQAAWVIMYLVPGIQEMPSYVIGGYALCAQAGAWAALKYGSLADKDRQRVAAISGIALLLAILGVAIFPTLSTTMTGIAIGLACFVIGEIGANFFITAMEGLISVEIGGQRAQLAGHALKFGAVGIASVVVSITAGVLTANLGAAAGAIALGAVIVLAFGAIFIGGFRALRIRHAGGAAG